MSLTWWQSIMIPWCSGGDFSVSAATLYQAEAASLHEQLVQVEGDLATNEYDDDPLQQVAFLVLYELQKVSVKPNTTQLSAV